MDHQPLKDRALVEAFLIARGFNPTRDDMTFGLTTNQQRVIDHLLSKQFVPLHGVERSRKVTGPLLQYQGSALVVAVGTIRSKVYLKKLVGRGNSFYEKSAFPNNVDDAYLADEIDRAIRLWGDHESQDSRQDRYEFKPGFLAKAYFLRVARAFKKSRPGFKYVEGTNGFMGRPNGVWEVYCGEKTINDFRSELVTLLGRAGINLNN